LFLPELGGSAAVFLQIGFAIPSRGYLGAATFVPALLRLPNSSMLMLTAGLLTLIEGLVLVVWGSDPFNLPPFSGEATFQLLRGLDL
jgi:branched-chain amino acid transport system permease protein